MKTDTLWNWTHSTLHNIRGVIAVLDLIALRRMGPWMISGNHPWVTGISPHTGRPIWPDNIAFASARPPHNPDTPSDAQIVTTIGRLLCSMVKRSTPNQEIPHGPKRRMPHAVNYIHGTVHYNGVFVIFNDFKDAILHLSDGSFVGELKRLAREEHREITLVLRDRNYQEVDYAFFMGFIRSTLPWYANGNGPKKRVFYGGTCGFLAINTINGSWIGDMYDLKRGRRRSLVRPPVDRTLYFQGRYRGDRMEPSTAEKLFAWLNYRIITLRGAQGGLVFTRRERIEPGVLATYRKTGRVDAGADWAMPTFTSLLRARSSWWNRPPKPPATARESVEWERRFSGGARAPVQP